MVIQCKKSTKKLENIFRKKKRKYFSQSNSSTIIFPKKRPWGKKIVVCQTFYSTYNFSATKGKSIIIIHEWKFSAAQRQMNL